ncbi:hypothetical protein [Acinetobacter bereziniae]|nr:hypothetical protein [Acinetobacter bereziniae]
MRELTLNEMEVISGTGTDAAKGVGESMTAWGGCWSDNWWWSKRFNGWR